VAGGNADKFCSVVAPRWLQVDLAGSFSVTSFTVRHAGAGGESATYNTRDFNIQTSTDNATWSTAVAVTANTANVTSHPIAARTARYVRLNITTPTQTTDAAARIYELEVYGTGTTTPTPTPTATAGTTTNLALGRAITSSVAGVQNPAFVTDGDKSGASFAGVPEGPQWIQIDLGQSYSLSQVNLWHYFADARTYRDVIVRVSTSADFSSGVTTVFNNDADNSAGQGVGTHPEYAESAAGRAIPFTATTARYVRLWTNGSSANVYNHYVEVEVWGR
jgi:hypothetical protein